MTSTRPYLIRAIYEWSCDNNLTPHMLVDATADNVTVPEQFITDGVRADEIALRRGGTEAGYVDPGIIGRRKGEWHKKIDYACSLCEAVIK